MNSEFISQTGITDPSAAYQTAQTISTLIKSADHMVGIQSPIVLNYMKHGLAMWLEGSDGNIGGFIKAVPWHPNLALVEGGLKQMEQKAIENMVNGIKPTGFESGSLFITEAHRKHGLGSKLKDELAQQILENYPGIPLFSVVDKANVASVHLNKKLGWIPLSQEQIPAFTEILGIDVLQGWDAYIFLHPESMKLI